MRNVLVTGGSGFFGGVLKRRLLAEGFRVVNIDLVPDADAHENLLSLQGDIRDTELLARLFEENRFEAVFHCAALLAHDVKSETMLWTSNVDGTRYIAEACVQAGVRKIVFISTNCLWGEDLGRAVMESDVPAPIEIYGRSKLAAEEELRGAEDRHPGALEVITLRCPTIIDSGRLGLLAILFEFIDDGKKVWVVGDGSNRYQFVFASDLADACIAALAKAGTWTFNVGSRDVPTMREMYEEVIRAAGTKSRVASLPKGPAIALMKLAHGLGLSPLGPYHYRMIAENFIFDTSAAERELGWRPTLSNAEMMTRAYAYYRDNRHAIHQRGEAVAAGATDSDTQGNAPAASAHNRAAPMGIIRLLKWVS